MTAIDIITTLAALSLAWLIWMVFKAKEDTQWDEDINRDHEAVKLKDIEVGHAIYDMFPEWREEFKSDPMMDEIAATCDMYLVLKEIQKDGKISHKLAVIMNDAIVRFEKYAL